MRSVDIQQQLKNPLVAFILLVAQLFLLRFFLGKFSFGIWFDLVVLLTIPVVGMAVGFLVKSRTLFYGELIFGILTFFASIAG
ncbi:MAG: hypothetical protein HYT41_02925 [Candidatus Sungbacteria bacterium]|nr:hypothetical protein [Candidatus Sungbacteria bacterium]